ncbi:class I SAM-dependent methyltransferase [Novilysobacter avium]|uniref:Methyltransferase domain-containing protein n=1 Tax=Novilysobacter avium TaxID=2781023 RepID=A0A7S6UJY5_9GAMM|nr:methyltransferase domain-containing protein [Lysobacter avium]QOW21682.1 methyltransferase domain-containing protein [Lysobacter avium]
MVQYQSFPSAAGDSRTLDKLLALKLPELSGRSFLDVGCNEGFFCGFARFLGAARSVGIDRSAEFVNRAKSRFPDCEFLAQDWSQLPEGLFDVILLASAVHYADDQPELIKRLVDKLAPDGVLVLELGLVSSPAAEWVKVKRGIDERYFPTMAQLKLTLAGFAWKWMGPSVNQAGDPVARHVVHIARRRPVAYLLMQPPGYGKSSLASELFHATAMPVVSGDRQISLLAKGNIAVSEPLRQAVADGYSPFRIDEAIRRVFDGGLESGLVDAWLAEADGRSFVLDMYVPEAHQARVEALLSARGYMPVRLNWDRIGQAPLSGAVMTQQAEAFYLSMVEQDSERDGESAVRIEPVGFVDEISVEGNALVIRGWAVDAGGNLPKDIAVKIGRRTLQAERVDRQLRPDVQSHLGLPHALVGYRLSLDSTGVRQASDLGSGFKVFVPEGVVFRLADARDRIFHGNQMQNQPLGEWE